ncbi:putative inactive receptor kinase [Quercus suber]|uniref:Inactive receptor kinase n=1 Tax=Quercus suber TaxID=58331 RepID=A0AAW0MIS9_QUESU
MNQVSIWVILISFFLLLHMSYSVEEEIKTSLISFLAKLANNNAQLGVSLGWNSSLDPCKRHWRGVTCDQKNTSVTKLVLIGLNLNGTLDATSLCGTQALAASIAAFFLNGNNIGGGISSEIAKCKQFTHLYLSGNQFSGSLPNSFAMLGNLKRLDISRNKFSGDLPELSRISGLTMFLAQDNQLSGGPIPDVGGRFSNSGFSGNPESCGQPLSKECPSLPLNGGNNSKSKSKDQTLMYTDYVVLAFACLVLIIFKLCKLKKRKERVEGLEAVNKVAVVDDRVSKLAPTSTEYKSSVSRSENTGNSSESALVLNSMHRNILPALAFYCSKYEKLLVYEYQQNRSLFMLLHGTICYISGNNQMGEAFDWASRLGVAASIADTLAFMHQELKEYRIVHGNLKSSNILMNKNMELCISEFGLMAVDSDQYGSSFAIVTGTSASRDFNGDINGFGVILQELLTGKMVQNKGVDLADWVHSVVQQEDSCFFFHA